MPPALVTRATGTAIVVKLQVVASVRTERRSKPLAEAKLIRSKAIVQSQVSRLLLRDSQLLAIALDST